MFRKTLTAIAFTALTVGSANALTIDAFDVTQTVSDTSAAGPTTGTASGASIIGTEREVSVLQAGGSSASTLNFNNPAGLLAYDNGSDNSGTATILYDGAGSIGLGGVDATVSNTQDAFDLRIVFSDFAMSVEISVGDGTNTASQTLSTLGGLNTGSNFPLLFEYTNFTGGPVNFQSLQFIQVMINAPTATDLQLDFFGTTTTEVPEPAALAILGLGLAGLGFARRRRG